MAGKRGSHVGLGASYHDHRATQIYLPSGPTVGDPRGLKEGTENNLNYRLNWNIPVRSFYHKNTGDMEMDDYQRKASYVQDAADQTTKKDLAGLRFGSFLSAVDMHGIQNLQKSRHFLRRIIWVTFLLGVLCVCFWQLSGVVQKFIDAPSSTNFEYIHSRRLDFPAVTFCNVNPFRKSKVYDISDEPFITFFNKTDQESHGAGVKRKPKQSMPNGPNGMKSNKSSNTDFDWDDIDYDSTRDDFDNTQEYYARYMGLGANDKATISYALKDMLIDCSWFGKSCSPVNFTQTYNPRFGNCFTFNGKNESGLPLKKTQSPGPLHGFSVILFIDQDQYSHTVADAAGIKVVVHDQAVMPFPQDQGQLVAPGFSTQIGLTKVAISRMSYPHGDCKNLTKAEGEEKDAYVDLIFGVNYTVAGCEKTCLQKAIVETCKCKYAVLNYDGKAFKNTDVPNAKFCELNKEDTRKCIENVHDLLYEDKLNCSAKCPIRCTESLFLTSSAMSVWPAIAREEEIIEMINEINPKVGMQIKAMPIIEARDFLNRNLVKLSVFYTNMMYQNIVSEEAYSWVEMVSDIGGTVELYIGMSLVTFFQLIELLIDFCLIGARGEIAG